MKTGAAILDPITYLTAYTLLRSVDMMGKELLINLDVCSHILGNIKAKSKIHTLGKGQKEELNTRIGILEEDLQYLSSVYEPMLDTNPYSYGKYGAYREALSAILTEEKCILTEYKMLRKEMFDEMPLDSPAQKRAQRLGGMIE